MPIRELTQEQADKEFWEPRREQLEREREYVEWCLFGHRDGTPKPECPSPALRNMQKWD